MEKEEKIYEKIETFDIMYFDYPPYDGSKVVFQFIPCAAIKQAQINKHFTINFIIPKQKCVFNSKTTDVVMNSFY